MNLRSIAQAIGRRTWQVVAAAMVTLLTGCGNLMGDVDGNWQMPPQASTQAAEVDWIYYFIFWLCVFYFVHIIGIMGWFMWKYRARPGREVEPSPHHSLWLEIAWSIPPVLLCVVMFWFGFTHYMTLSTPPADAIKVEVTASKWNWDFKYHTGGKGPVLHLPKGKPVVFLMKSNDVLHSFYLPKMRVKKDVVPGRTTKCWTEANRAGEYTLFCAEYCGKDHSVMRAKVIVHETEAAWLAAIAPRESSPKELFEQHCTSCHNIEKDVEGTGPSLLGIGGSMRDVAAGPDAATEQVKADRAYLKESIVKPGAWLSRKNGTKFENAMNQTFGKQLKPEEIERLVDYLMDPKAAEAKFAEDMKKAAKKKTN